MPSRWPGKEKSPASRTIRLANHDTPGWAFDVATLGTMALVADYSAGLQLIDLSNPSAPSLIGHYTTAGIATRVLVSESHAIVGHSAGVDILDLSNPALPFRIGQVQPADPFQDIAISGNSIFIAETSTGGPLGSANLEVFDISNPSLPVLRSRYNTTAGRPEAVGAKGNLAFLATSTSPNNLGQIIDFSDPATP